MDSKVYSQYWETAVTCQEVLMMKILLKILLKAINR